MENKILGPVKALYRKWKDGFAVPQGPHPDAEELAGLAEGLLEEGQAASIKAHLVSCRECAESFALSLKAGQAPAKEVPAQLLAEVRDLLLAKEGSCLWQIVLRLKGKALEIINTAGDVLIGQELVPVVLLRSRSIKEFKDEVVIFKDFKDIRVEARIENQQAKAFSLTITARNKQTGKAIKDLRVTLAKGDVELESYLADSGGATFEHVLLGKYTVELSSLDGKVASILLDIKV